MRSQSMSSVIGWKDEFKLDYIKHDWMEVGNVRPNLIGYSNKLMNINKLYITIVMETA